MGRRRKQGAAEDIMELVAKLPWWAGVGLAVGSYLILHPIAERPAPVATQLDQLGSMAAQVIWRTMAFYGQYLLPVFCLVGAVVSALKRRSRKQLIEHSTANPAGDAFNSMSWQQFEQLVGEGFRRLGYQIKETGRAGPDGGVDLELRRGGELHLVQCKQWRAQRVGVDVVRELYGVMAAQGAAGGFVVTSGRFTAEAENFAVGRNVQLIDGEQLKSLLEPNAHHRQPVSATTQGDDTGVKCPLCDNKMVLRVAKRGSQSGNRFWGCSDFPSCRGTRDVSLQGK